MKAIEQRLAKLERESQVRTPVSPRHVIMISGGLSDGLPDHATAGGLQWERGPGESHEAFEGRAMADAAAARAEFLVLGGLPGMPCR